MHQVIENNKNDLHCASVTAFPVSSANYNNLSDMLNVAEQEIGFQKKNFPILTNDDINSDWEVINEQLSQTFNTFFKSLRLYKDTLDMHELKQLYLGIINATS